MERFCLFQNRHHCLQFINNNLWTSHFLSSKSFQKGPKYHLCYLCCNLIGNWKVWLININIWFLKNKERKDMRNGIMRWSYMNVLKTNNIINNIIIISLLRLKDKSIMIKFRKWILIKYSTCIQLMKMNFLIMMIYKPRYMIVCLLNLFKNADFN